MKDHPDGLLSRLEDWVHHVLEGEADPGEVTEAAPDLPAFRWEPVVSDWYRCCVCRVPPDQVRRRVEKLESDAFGAGAGKKPKKLDRVAEQFCSEPAGYVLALIGEDRVIGAILMFRRFIRYRGKGVMLGGIGGVTTERRYRGKGVASAMMSSAMAALGELNCDVALLCTDLQDDRLTRLYGRFGFVPLDRPYSYEGKSGHLYVNDDGMIAPVLSEEKFRLLRDSAPVLHIGVGNF